ncbi:uncharacterized protein K452DRAFT_56183 [Aplosporella prunicola CBS 121167]|uniref:Uncharacterized protein n=1 Tax=Aplosporella prunicola CBS 121167 TaxID=1176127 RepID=A0A6A6B708_9PEZI|nr:uncharacterized protein K452DRAFT_56183 [Aplosporella prunicola CBS 121167]KAF2139800.1 hypothetical protein K452DRAFT_56183 [Aplosporella prunicola CBS 121167]
MPVLRALRPCSRPPRGPRAHPARRTLVIVLIVAHSAAPARRQSGDPRVRAAGITGATLAVAGYEALTAGRSATMAGWAAALAAARARRPTRGRGSCGLPSSCQMSCDDPGRASYGREKSA